MEYYLLPVGSNIERASVNYPNIIQWETFVTTKAVKYTQEYLDCAIIIDMRSVSGPDGVNGVRYRMDIEQDTNGAWYYITFWTSQLVFISEGKLK